MRRGNNDVFDALLRLSLYPFAERCFVDLNPGTSLLRNWHIAVMCDRLEKLHTGKYRRLIINMPPRHLKSHTASVAYVAWLLGHAPAMRIICVSHNEKLATEFSYLTRKIMTSAWYKRLFPGTRIAPDDAGKSAFRTTKGGGRRATWPGDGITGFGADLIIVDDILTPEDAKSGKIRQDVKDWYDKVLYSRLNNKRTGKILHVQHRIHLDDTTAHVLEQEVYEHLVIQAIAEEDQEFADIGDDCIHRAKGDILHPELEGEAELKRARSIMGEAAFAAQYQQRPMPSGGASFRSKWFKPYDKLPDLPDFVIQSWDTAVSVEPNADYSACTTWAVIGRKYYLVDALNRRMTLKQLGDMALTLNKRHWPDLIIIEGGAVGIPLCETLRRHGIPQAQIYNPRHDKLVRAEESIVALTDGRVYVPWNHPCTKLVMDQMLAFPEGRHDDLVDSVTQFLRDPEGWKRVAKPYGRPEREHRQRNTPSALPQVRVVSLKSRLSYWERNNLRNPFDL